MVNESNSFLSSSPLSPTTEEVSEIESETEAEVETDPDLGIGAGEMDGEMDGEPTELEVEAEAYQDYLYNIGHSGDAIALSERDFDLEDLRHILIGAVEGDQTDMVISFLDQSLFPPTGVLEVALISGKREEDEMVKEILPYCRGDVYGLADLGLKYYSSSLLRAARSDASPSGEPITRETWLIGWILTNDMAMLLRETFRSSLPRRETLSEVLRLALMYNRPEIAEEMAKRLGSPEIGMEVDLWHLYLPFSAYADAYLRSFALTHWLNRSPRE